MKRLIKIVCVTVAFLCLGIGSFGIVLPILPTTPFLLLALVLFAKGSDRFHSWFISTQLYKNNLEDFVMTKSMTLKAKIRVLTTITVLFSVGIWFSPPFAKVIILVIAVFHYVYFCFGIQTIKSPVQKAAMKDSINDC